MQHLELPRKISVAQQVGSKHYFTGRPCPKGHVAMRLTSTGHCVECSKLRSKARLSQMDVLIKSSPYRENPLPFDEKGLLDAVRGKKPGIPTIRAMIKYYENCKNTCRDRYIRGYIDMVIDGLCLRIRELEHSTSRMFVTVQ